MAPDGKWADRYLYSGDFAASGRANVELKIGDFILDLPVVQTGAGNAPSVLRAAAYFWLASALISGVVPAIVMAVQPADPALVAVSVGLVILLTVLQAWAAFRLLKGAAWARWVLSVVAVLSLGGAVSAQLTPLIVAGLVLTLAGAVLMWMPAASGYIRQRRASRV